MINLISDTVTKPSPGMLDAMMSASVGDDVFRTDPTVNALEAKAAEMFGMEAALFCPSGTMSNQIALKVHTQPLDEVLCEENSHIYQYETGGYAFHSGVALQLLKGKDGILSTEQIDEAVRPDLDWLPRTRLLVIENSANRAGGNYYTMEELIPVVNMAREKGLALHLDGARLFNVLVETGDTPVEYGRLFNSISICLSKGLGAPAGTLLLGNEAFIKQARRVRKVMGGGMRQTGFLAAAGIYALDNNIIRLKEDNQKAKTLGSVLEKCSFVDFVRPVKTNIVIFDLKSPSAPFLKKLQEHGINASSFGPKTVRMVTHMDISAEMIDQVSSILPGIEMG